MSKFTTSFTSSLEIYLTSLAPFLASLVIIATIVTLTVLILRLLKIYK